MNPNPQTDTPPKLTSAPEVSVVTPSLNNLEFLKRCCASVADQDGVRVEHLVIDGGSTDGTVAWLRSQPGLRWISEPDTGMYDAINKGLRLAQGQLLAYLNCDEQYLPGALSAAIREFECRPDAGLVFADALVVRPDGTLLACRKSYPLRWHYIATSHLYVMSCALFWRRTVLNLVPGFDARFKARGDAEFVLNLLRAGIRTSHLRRYVAAFTHHSSNLGASPLAAAEEAAAREALPSWLRASRYALIALRRIEKLFHGAYSQKMPFSYALYTEPDIRQRRTFHAERTSVFWP